MERITLRTVRQAITKARNLIFLASDDEIAQLQQELAALRESIALRAKESALPQTKIKEFPCTTAAPVEKR